MDKCREEFEKWLDDNNMFMNIERRFDQESNTYDYCAIRWIWESWQHQQAKVEELKASHHGEVIGHEVHFKKIKQERDELQTLYIQQGINMLKLQKRVDALELKIKEIANIAMRARRGEYQTESGRNAGLNIAAQIERALKGDQYDEHRKKAEEAISKGASLTNHRIEL
ncbi:hypothetical protein WKW51_05790 [Acinetobacter baumannii]|uniref:hypothetical protein n=1 Tax=Acinetobacter baumannii TaxID=470 RepID=UPI002A0A46B2|nr:hypothetical protein [Acinetobacter baumannii]MCZ3342478.1 hypothetical protein [Acinetobacter baumannii]